METEEIQQKLSSILEDAQKRQSEIKAEFDAWAQTKKELEDKITKIGSLASSAERKDSEIGELLSSAQQSKSALDAAQTNVVQLKNDIESYYQQFTELKNKLDDPESGLSKNLDWSQGQRNEIDTKHQEVTKLQAQAEILKTEIEKYRDEIVKIKDESDALKTSIAKTLDLVTTGSLTESFIERRGIIADVTKSWLMGLVLSTLGLGWVFFNVYSSLLKDGFADWHLLHRYLIASPLIYLVYVCAHNYRIEREYEERYAFKAVLATSLESYIKLLSEKFSEEKEQLLEFTLNTIKTIYEKPYTRSNAKTRYNFSLWNVFRGEFEKDDRRKNDDDVSVDEKGENDESKNK